MRFCRGAEWRRGIYAQIFFRADKIDLWASFRCFYILLFEGLKSGAHYKHNILYLISCNNFTNLTGANDMVA